MSLISSERALSGVEGCGRRTLECATEPQADLESEIPKRYSKSRNSSTVSPDFRIIERSVPRAMSREW